jgi:hypothetical protein
MRVTAASGGARHEGGIGLQQGAAEGAAAAHMQALALLLLLCIPHATMHCTAVAEPVTCARLGLLWSCVAAPHVCPPVDRARRHLKLASGGHRVGAAAAQSRRLHHLSQLGTCQQRVVPSEEEGRRRCV